MRVNPVLRNESKIAVRSIKFTLMIFAYIAVLSVAVMIYYSSVNEAIFSNGLYLESSETILCCNGIRTSDIIAFHSSSIKFNGNMLRKRKANFRYITIIKINSLSNNYRKSFRFIT
ncbi:hypothetical protein [Clostridium sp.]|uniref:hypothetical protein n=1 Tax=Clostridium sp. TaxID=1506 RepID=UPI0035208B3D